MTTQQQPTVSAPAQPARWVDDPHDIEQGQMFVACEKDGERCSTYVECAAKGCKRTPNAESDLKLMTMYRDRASAELAKAEKRIAELEGTPSGGLAGVTDDRIIELAGLHKVARPMKPIGLDTGDVLYADAGYRTGEILSFARALLAEASGQAVATEVACWWTGNNNDYAVPANGRERDINPAFNVPLYRHPPATTASPQAQQQAEGDRLDAERYRWLRIQHNGGDLKFYDELRALAFTVFHPVGGELEPVECMPGALDKAIDAARGAEPSETHMLRLSLVEAVETVLNEAPCDCPNKMRFERGDHLSGCHLFDLNNAFVAAYRARHVSDAGIGSTGGEGA